MYLTSEQITAQLTSTQRAQCNHLAFIIMRPDALERGLHPQIAKSIEKHGLSLVGWKHMYIEDRDIEEVYRFTQLRLLEREMRPLWWLTRRMYAAAPALVTLWAGNFPAEYRSLSHFVEEIKGPSNPALTRPGQLRHSYPAINVVLCTVHSSDDSLEALREAAIFFSIDEVRSAIDRVPFVLKGERQEVHRRFFDYCSMWNGVRARSEGFFGTLVNVKARILARLYELEEFPRAALFEIYAAMRTAVADSSSYRLVAEQMHGLLEREAQLIERYQLEKYTRSNATTSETTLLEILGTLARHEDFESLRFCHVSDVMKRNLIPLDAWEFIVLESSFIFHKLQLNGYSAR